MEMGMKIVSASNWNGIILGIVSWKFKGVKKLFSGDLYRVAQKWHHFCTP